jgi:hypothetical protein
MGSVWWVFRQTSQSCQEVAISDFTLNNICWVNTVEYQCLATLISEVIRRTTPVKLFILDVLPELVALMLFSVYEECLRPMRESWVIPWNASLNDIFKWQFPQSCF